MSKRNSNLITAAIFITLISVNADLSFAQSGFEPAFSSIVRIKSAELASGTGVVIGKTPTEIIVLTNRHVVWSPDFGEKAIFEKDVRTRTKVFFNTKQLGPVSQIRYDKSPGALDVAALYVEVGPELNIKMLTLSRLENRRGSNAWVVGYPAGKQTAAILQAEINDEDALNYDFSLNRNLIGGESGSALLDARGDVVGIVTQAGGLTRNIAIKATAMMPILVEWNIEIMAPSRAPVIAFPTIFSASGNKHLQKVADKTHKRMIAYTEALEQVRVISLEKASYLLDLMKEKRPGFMAGEMSFYLPTHRLDAVLEEEKEGFILRFELRSIPDNGMLPVSFSAAATGADGLAETALAEFVEQFGLQVEFHGVKHGWRKRSFIVGIIGAGASAALIPFAASKKGNYENAFTAPAAEDRFTAMRWSQIARNSALTATAAGLGFWLNASVLNPRKAKFSDKEELKYVTSK